MSDIYTEPVMEAIYWAKSRMPAGWKIIVEDHDGLGAGMLIYVPMKELGKYSIQDQIRIAETTNYLREKIAGTGLPCGVQKV